MIKVANEVRIVDYKIGADPELIIKNHWNRENIVVLEIGGRAYEFMASDIIAAIKNATNSNRITI